MCPDLVVRRRFVVKDCTCLQRHRHQRGTITSLRATRRAFSTSNRNAANSASLI
jgi:hypothetical protein